MSIIEKLNEDELSQLEELKQDIKDFIKNEDLELDDELLINLTLYGNFLNYYTDSDMFVKLSNVPDLAKFVMDKYEYNPFTEISDIFNECYQLAFNDLMININTDKERD